jgi:uncharacterized SAM-binding protein YcdF (DUF218 family)
MSSRFDAAVTTRVARALENRIAPANLPASLNGIIVLGGSPSRVKAALEIAERFPGIPVVLSGPGTHEIAVARKTAAPTTPVTIDRRATTTYENAVYSKDLVGPQSGDCWAVVTSAVHMPRAIGAFEAVGFPVLPWPVDDTPAHPVKRSAWVWHEVFGLMGYWAFGRSSTLYPAQKTICAATEMASN